MAKEKIEITVFDTKAQEGNLAKLIEGLDGPPCPEDWTEILRAGKKDGVPGLYEFCIISESIRESNHANVRVVKNQIWTGKYATTIDAMLQENRVGYKKGIVEISSDKLMRQDAARIGCGNYMPDTGWQITPL